MMEAFLTPSAMVPPDSEKVESWRECSVNAVVDALNLADLDPYLKYRVFDSRKG